MTDAERLAAARMQVARLREALESAIPSIEEEWQLKATDLREALDLSEEVALTDARIDELLREIAVAAQSRDDGSIDAEAGQLPATGKAREDMREAVRMWLRGDL